MIENNKQTPATSNWRNQSARRARNRKWLGYSGQIARRIHASLAENQDLNQARLAEKLDVTPQYISKLLQGKENLTLETIGRISEVLGVELISFPDYQYNRVERIMYKSLSIEERLAGIRVVQKENYSESPLFAVLPNAGNTQYAMGA